MYRSLVVAGIVTTLVVGLSLLHVYHLPLVPSRVLEPTNRVRRLEGICRQRDPFENEYGRTNLRTSRAYEGVSSSAAFVDLRLALSGTPSTTKGSSRGASHHLGHWRER